VDDQVGDPADRRNVRDLCSVSRQQSLMSVSLSSLTATKMSKSDW
jgi:hypothetical protein